jgi:hypothetical protein
MRQAPMECGARPVGMEDPPGIKTQECCVRTDSQPRRLLAVWSSLAPTGHQRTSGYEKAQRDAFRSDGRALVEVVKWGRCTKEPPGIKPRRGAHSRIPATDDDDSRTAFWAGTWGW